MSNSFIIAIDFGTAYSGYAYSITPRKAKLEPNLKRWGTELGLDTPKTPTCILFNEHEEFLKFGYEARAEYLRMSGEEARRHYLFETFKMALYGKELNRTVTIQAANGKSMKAVKVFAEALRYLKEDALTTINSHKKGAAFRASDFTWVLTVPAIWSPSAKQFMREAATDAGIVSKGKEDQLVITLEPEAASLWCKTLPADGFIAENHDRTALEHTSGTQYIVADCGGGTIDITVHEVLDGGALKELHKVSGNDMGGQTVDQEFKDFLREIFSDGVWDEYERSYPSEAQRIMYDFTYLKQKDADAQITCPFKLGDLAQRKRPIERYFEGIQGATWNDGSIKISKEKMRSFFDHSLRGISNSLRQILMKDLQIDYILLVGGYASSEVLRQYITKEFGRQCKVLCPHRPQEAIMRGAVMFGRNPELVSSRKSAFTYGLAVSEKFDESRHKPEKKFTNKRGDWCRNIFSTLVKEGEDVGWDETREHIYHPIDDDQTGMDLRFFRTERKNLMYVDEWGIEQVGTFHVDMPDITGGVNREVLLAMKFGSTEITATATDKVSRSTGSIRIDFMSNNIGPATTNKILGGT